MELITHDEVIENPTGDEIKAVVLSLGGAENHFAVLEKENDGLTYIQTSNWKNLGFILEYQEGSLQCHYRTISNLTPDQVRQAFVWYLLGDESWWSAFVWTKMEVGGGQKSSSQQEEKKSENISPEAELTVEKALNIFRLKRGATKEDLKKQYRAMVAQCHPDRVNHLDNEFQTLAEEKTKLLNEAYRILGKIISLQ